MNELRPFPPDARKLLMVRYVGASVVLALFEAAPAVFIGFLVHPVAGVATWLVLVAATLAFSWWWSGLQYRRRGWQVTPATVELRLGVIWRRVALLPRNRVQNVTIDSGPIRRYFGLVNVMVHSAGAATPNIALEGLMAEDAERLQQELLARGVPATVPVTP